MQSSPGAGSIQVDLTGQRALVTGGAGFLGSHLCDALLADGYSVIAVDNLLTGNLSNFDHLRNDSRFEFRQIDRICGEFPSPETLRCGRPRPARGTTATICAMVAI